MKPEHPGNAADSQRQLLANMTGELCQPMRIYYQVPDRLRFERKLRSLKCMQSDPAKGRWVWLFHAEARRLEFERGYLDIPKRRRPIVLGRFRFASAAEAYLELRSPERALQALPFFDRYLGRTFAEATEFSIVNRLLDATEKTDDFEPFFRQEVRIDLAEQLDRHKDDPSEAMALVFDAMNKKEPDVVRLPLNYYEDGIDSVRVGLRLRQSMALERWQGHDVAIPDIIDRLIGR